VPLSGGSETVVCSLPAFVVPMSIRLSPNGLWIACIYGDVVGGVQVYEIGIVDLSSPGNPMTTITSSKLLKMYLDWSEDSNWIAFARSTSSDGDYPRPKLFKVIAVQNSPRWGSGQG
jgi:Tol biopolymer transport system component